MCLYGDQHESWDRGPWIHYSEQGCLGTAVYWFYFSNTYTLCVDLFCAIQINGVAAIAAAGICYNITNSIRLPWLGTWITFY